MKFIVFGIQIFFDYFYGPRFLRLLEIAYFIKKKGGPKRQRHRCGDNPDRMIWVQPASWLRCRVLE